MLLFNFHYSVVINEFVVLCRESIPSGGGGGGGGGSGGGAGNRPTGSMFHHQANSSGDAGKSEWKSLYSTSGAWNLVTDTLTSWVVLTTCWAFTLLSLSHSAGAFD